MSVKTIIKNALILFCITLAAGLSLSFVNGITQNSIVRAQEDARQAAFKAVYEEADSFKKLDGYDSLIEQFNASLSEKDYPGVSIEGIQKAVNSDGKCIGVIVTAITSKGYGGDIELVMGVSKDGTLNGISVLSMNESPGLGAKCTTPEFQDQFKGIKAEIVKYTKKGASADNEIDVISGATITTKAITSTVNAGLQLANSCMSNLE
jgi:electron transport complex protein RnfG